KEIFLDIHLAPPALGGPKEVHAGAKVWVALKNHRDLDIGCVVQPGKFGSSCRAHVAPGVAELLGHIGGPIALWILVRLIFFVGRLLGAQMPDAALAVDRVGLVDPVDRKSTRLNSSHQIISYAV